MKVIALVSGGKDSTFSIMECVRHGHQVVALVNLRPPHSLSARNEQGVSGDDGDEPLVQELDSYMYQSVGNEVIEAYAEALGLPLYRRSIEGTPLNAALEYAPTDERDEVEDLYRLLEHARDDLERQRPAGDLTPAFEAVTSGAILSTYQRNRVENVCARLGVRSLAYLWAREQQALLDEMIDRGLHAILIKVACYGLRPEAHLGRSLVEMRPHLHELARTVGANVCGEGGEYESLTLDCPLFRKRIVIDACETRLHANDAFAPVAYLLFRKFHLEEKSDIDKETKQQQQQPQKQTDVELATS